MEVRCLHIFVLVVTSLAVTPVTSDDDDFSMFWGGNNYGGGNFWNPFGGNNYYYGDDSYERMPFGPMGNSFNPGGDSSQERFGYPRYGNIGRGGGIYSRQNVQWKGNALKIRRDSSEERTGGNIGVMLGLNDGGDSSEERTGVNIGGPIVVKTGRDSSEETTGLIGGLFGKNSDSSEEGTGGLIGLKDDGDSSEEMTGGLFGVKDSGDSSEERTGGFIGVKDDEDSSEEKGFIGGLIGKIDSGDSSEENTGGLIGGLIGLKGGRSGSDSSGGTSTEDSSIRDSWGWSKWVLTFGACSVTCGAGTQQVCKTRTCLLKGPAKCPGKTKEFYKLACTMPACPSQGYGGWGSWVITSRGRCSVSCGGGTQVITQSRSCMNFIFRRLMCIGKNIWTYTCACNTQKCNVAVNGGWSAWVEIKGLCPVTCGGGKQMVIRSRTCNNPVPSGGGLQCSGSSKGVYFKPCNVQPCDAKPVHGQWSAWIVSYSQCSVPCGGGHRVCTRRRQCNNPPPSNGGNKCEGKATMSTKESCNTKPCPVHGQWSAWIVSQGQCSKSCGGGQRILIKRRQCNNPPPSYGGNNCTGKSISTTKEVCKTHDCMKPAKVHGQWSAWIVSQGQCSKSCGGGQRMLIKRRECNNPPSSNGGNNCTGKAISITMEVCNTHDCMKPAKVHGQWSAWIVSQGQCSKSCGGGQRILIKRRQCNNPPPSNRGNNCTGNAISTTKEVCNTRDCMKPAKMHGQWSAWIVSQGQCSKSCGGGQRMLIKRRECNNPPSSNGGNNCSGKAISITMEVCNTHDCMKPAKVHGQWSAWIVSQGQCSKSCGGGQRILIKRRQCNNPPPSYGGNNCTGKSISTTKEVCNTHDCMKPAKVHGQWSAWIDSRGKCSKSCGGGQRIFIRGRRCNNPPPSNGGNKCVGEAILKTMEVCNTHDCMIPIKVHGQWSAWVVSHGQCSVSCGGGHRASIKRRQCNNPPPRNGGNKCVGKAISSTMEDCNKHDCVKPIKVHGQWSAWIVSDGKCSVSCGGGQRASIRKRQCNNPPPSNGGNDCVGKAISSTMEDCNTHDCLKPPKVHGQWSAWIVSHGKCSVSCGGGQRASIRKRQCNNPPPSNGGNNCVGKAISSTMEDCNKHDCLKPPKVHGQWSAWIISHGQCSVSCGGGQRASIRKRQCNNPPPSNGGNDCVGKAISSTMEDCNKHDCLKPPKVDGQWSAWIVSHGQCSVSCGGGQRASIRKRQCNNPPPSNGGNDCVGKAISSTMEYCNTHDCLKPPKVHGQWSAWIVSYGKCSVSCGGGQRSLTKTRQCNNPPPSDDGNNCEGKAKVITKESCNTKHCPVDGQWSAWVISYGDCSVSCGGGQRVVMKRRKCNNPAPSNGGNHCKGEATSNTMAVCNTHDCSKPTKVDGQWSAWVISYGDCSVSCGGGQRVVMKKRKCNNPAPRNGGNYCVGEATSSTMEVCNANTCLTPTKVDGQWSAWVISYGDCSASCGGGQRLVIKRRKCNNPAPRNGGNNCVGEATSSTMEVCNTDDCLKPTKVDGQWSAWVVSYGDCSTTCGGGQRVVMKKRKCNNPAPRNGGNYCQGEATSNSMEVCNPFDCLTPTKVHGQWSTWVFSYGDCSASCGGGQRVVMKKRKCNNPAPRNGGNYCVGEAASSKMEVCNTYNCPPTKVDGQWSAWVISYGQCSKTCGAGQKEVIRHRTCTNPPPSSGGKPCIGGSTERGKEHCFVSACPGKPDTGVCLGSTVVKGVGFNRDKSDCSMYVQCDYDEDDDKDKVVSGVFYRQCPHGLHWDQESLMCSLPEIAKCPLDKCKTGNIQSYASSSTCGGFWECVDGKSIGRCCPKGQAYVADGYCVVNNMCVDLCSLPDTCDKRAVPGQPTMFEQYIAGSGWQMLMCNVGESFDKIVCMCAPKNYNGTECKAEVHITFDNAVADVSGNDNYLENNGVVIINGTGYFNGKSGIVIPRFSSVDYGSTVIMKVKYKDEGVATGQQAIITNADCGSVGSLFITRGANATYFGERDEGGSLTTVTIQHTDSDWKDAQFELFDGKLTGTVNSVSSFAKTEGTVQDTDCAIHIGRGTGFDNFHGYIDELAIYLCKPI